MVGWHHRLDLSLSKGQGRLAYSGLWPPRVKYDLATKEQSQVLPSSYTRWHYGQIDLKSHADSKTNFDK